MSKAAYRRTRTPPTLPTLAEFAERAAKVRATEAKDQVIGEQMRVALFVEVVQMVAKSDMREDYARLRALARLAVSTLPPF